jgi:hypothetical protein
MKKSSVTENNFEVEHVTKTLVDNGYIERLPENYNQELFLKRMQKIFASVADNPLPLRTGINYDLK